MYQACYFLSSVHAGMPNDMLLEINSAVVTGLALVDSAILERYPHIPGIYEFKPRYSHPKRAEKWKDVFEVMKDGWGDCKDFVAWRLAELWEQGITASAESSLERHRFGRLLFHTYIRYPNGATEDPAKLLGMP